MALFAQTEMQWAFLSNLHNLYAIKWLHTLRCPFARERVGKCINWLNGK